MSLQSGSASDQQVEVLSQKFTLGFTYTRSTGPVVGRFLSSLRDGKVVGVKGSDGRVIVPPVEYDPVTAEALTEFVDVADKGEVVNWCWVAEPTEHHPLSHPFAWGMVKLDGADTPILHAIDTQGDASQMATGMKVRVRWLDQAQGNIKDIVCFEPGDISSGHAPQHDFEEPVVMMDAPTYLDYNYTAGNATARYLHQIRKGKIVGQKAPGGDFVYVPPRGSCPATGVATTEEVECADIATVESFTIVHIPIPGNPIKPPYVVANLLADGADVSFIHLLSEVDNDAVEIGMRVKAVWKPEEEWGYAMDNIRYWKPLDNESEKGGK